MTGSGDLTFAYNPFHQVTTVRKNGSTLATYGYDANKRRVYKQSNGESTLYFHSATGDVLSETREDGTPLVDYIYLNGQLTAKVSHNRRGGIYRDGETDLTDTILGLKTDVPGPKYHNILII